MMEGAVQILMSAKALVGAVSFASTTLDHTIVTVTQAT